MSEAAATTTAPSPRRSLTSTPASEVHPNNFVLVKTVSRNSYHHQTIEEGDERLRSGHGSNLSAFNFAADCAGTAAAAERMPCHSEEDVAAVVAGCDELMFGDTIELYGTSTSKGTTWSDVAVGFRPMAAAGLKHSSDEQVLSLLAPNTTATPARFIVLPPQGDTTAIAGKTVVRLHRRVVLTPAPSTTDAWDKLPPGPLSLNNKLAAGVNDLIGVRPRTAAAPKGGTAKGELHITFERSDAATASFASSSSSGSGPHEKSRSSFRLSTPITLRIVSTNRVRKTYDGQDIGHCRDTGLLVCGHNKTLFEFPHKLHPTPLTFRIAKVSTST